MLAKPLLPFWWSDSLSSLFFCPSIIGMIFIPLNPLSLVDISHQPQAHLHPPSQANPRKRWWRLVGGWKQSLTFIISEFNSFHHLHYFWVQLLSSPSLFLSSTPITCIISEFNSYHLHFVETEAEVKSNKRRAPEGEAPVEVPLRKYSKVGGMDCVPILGIYNRDGGFLSTFAKPLNPYSLIFYCLFGGGWFILESFPLSFVIFCLQYLTI